MVLRGVREVCHQVETVGVANALNLLPIGWIGVRKICSSGLVMLLLHSISAGKVGREVLLANPMALLFREGLTGWELNCMIAGKVLRTSSGKLIHMFQYSCTTTKQSHPVYPSALMHHHQTESSRLDVNFQLKIVP